MRFLFYTFLVLGLTLVNATFQCAYAQLGFDLKINKPEPYEDRILKSEKTGETPLKAPKRFFQNLTTHYNYFFNANTKLNEVIDGAKQGYKDDYTELLSFYNYTLDATSQNSKELDSVIYKSQTGIVMHDLRNDWIDNLYMLWGAAYFFEKKFDSAALMFQFINYSFAEKEKDGYYRYIGSRMDGNNALTISSKENNKFPKNLTTPPSRNNAFIWQVRSLIELGNFAEAGSLIATLKNDPVFPKRLHGDLEEVQALWYYRQQVWDSSATHLIKALDQAQTKLEMARWEYLAAQMFERSGKLDEAQTWYSKSIKHTTDPVMDIYARLNLVRINKEGGENYIDKNIAELLKMAKKDKYSEYRDVIYYMAAQMEMGRNNFAAAQELLLKASKYNNGNLASKNNSYLLIADLSFDQKKYAQAAAFYDSVQAGDLKPEQLARVEERKAALKKVIDNNSIIARQDSLQRIAAMPEEERTVYISKLVKQLLKKQGIEENTPTSGSANIANNAATDLFTNNSKGEWYFYNNNLKTQGSQKFKQTWGNRPNVDNWRRFADVNQQLIAKAINNTRDPNKGLDTKTENENLPSFNSLLNNLPLTETQMQASNDSVRNALYALGTVYLSEINDLPFAIKSFEEIRIRFPQDKNLDEVLFNLYYAYKKAGDETKAAEIKNLLLTKFPSSRSATILTTGKDPLAVNNKNGESGKVYEDIYNLFIEGKFEEALAEKKLADSIYKTNYWQPQLLYIQAVYHIKQREDSVAKNVLQTIISQSPNTSLAGKAQNLIDVLARRNQIETELANLKIERPKEDSIVLQAPAIKPVIKQDSIVYRPPVKKDSIITAPKNNVVINKPVIKTKVDTATRNPIVQQKPLSVYRFEPAYKHGVIIVLDKVDPMFVNEVKNAFVRYNKEKFYNQTFEASIIPFDTEKKFLLMTGFTNAQEAVDYVKRIKAIAHLEIIPWLKKEKFSFSIASDANLGILLDKKDLLQYKQFLEQNLPGIF